MVTDEEDSIEQINYHRRITFSVKDCENHTELHRNHQEISANCWGEYTFKVMNIRINIATYIAVQFDRPVYVTETVETFEQ